MLLPLEEKYTSVYMYEVFYSSKCLCIILVAQLHCCIKSDSYNHGRNFRVIVFMLGHVAFAPRFSFPRYSESFGELKFVHAGQNTALNMCSME